MINIEKLIIQVAEKHNLVLTQKEINDFQNHIIKNINKYYGIYILLYHPETLRNISKFKNIIDVASRLALNSTQPHKLGAVIVYKGKHIISSGYNRAEKYFKDNINLHAEIDAITNMKANKRFPQKLYSQCSIFIVRVNKSGDIKMASPCEKCLKKINNVGITKIYYTTNPTYLEDFVYDIIIKNL